MDSKCNNCSGYNLVGLAASLAVIISEQFDADDLDVLAAFVTALGDNLALLASTKEC
mgnify:CR=1 FL=1